MLLKLALIILNIAFAPCAFARLTNQEKFSIALKRRDGMFGFADLSQLNLADPTAIQYVPLEWKRPGQARFDFYRVEAKYNKHFLKGDFRDNVFNFQYDKGQSFLGPESVVSTVAVCDPKTKKPYLHIYDGNHEYLSAVWADSVTVPVRITQDFSAQCFDTDLELHWMLLKRGYTFPFDAQGRWRFVRQLSDLQNDPALEVVRKYVARFTLNADYTFRDLNGAKSPLWFKYREIDGVRMEENILATVLYEIYGDDIHLDRFDDRELERLRQKLVTLQDARHPLLKYIHLVRKPIDQGRLIIHVSNELAHVKSHSDYFHFEGPNLISLGQRANCLGVFSNIQ